jgi:two-component system, OmpR family, response regulator
MPEPRRRKILIVDDEPDLVEMLMLCVEASGRFTAASAADGVHALEEVRSFRPDVILLDVMMPHMNGWEFCQRLRADPGTREIPVVVMTAERLHPADPRPKEFSVRRVVPKPFDPIQLVSVLAEA